VNRKLWAVFLAVGGIFPARPLGAQDQPDKLSPVQIQQIRALIQKTSARHSAPGASFAIGMGGQIDDDPRALIPNRARGYVFEAGELKNSRWSDMSSKMAAGGWDSTAPDWVRFMNAWMPGRFVSPATMRTMLEPYKLRSATIDNFGLGWFIDDSHGMKAGLYGGAARRR
jgi:CubicO group peptidase (beta-lactamase class C family)